jgi:hypothetical protein
LCCCCSVAFDWELGRGLAAIALLSSKKSGRLKSSRARFIADAIEKIKKLTLLIFYRLITVNEVNLFLIKELT